jgi:hypothetical protein
MSFLAPRRLRTGSKFAIDADTFIDADSGEVLFNFKMAT